MQRLPPATVSTARAMLAEGWRPSRDAGVLMPPNDKHSGGWHLVGEDVWWAMRAMTAPIRGEVRA